MIRYMMAAALLLLAQAGTASVAMACDSGPTVVSAAVKSMNTQGGLNHYIITGTVTNNGASQASDVLQFVDIYKGPIKLDSKGVPPLKAGASYTFTYESERSADAGNGTTTLSFRMDQTRPSGAACAERQTVNF